MMSASFWGPLWRPHAPFAGLVCVFFFFLGRGFVISQAAQRAPPQNHGPGPRGLRAHKVSTHPQLSGASDRERGGAHSPCDECAAFMLWPVRLACALRLGLAAPLRLAPG
jgi:hypothetical protein